MNLFYFALTIFLRFDISFNKVNAFGIIGTARQFEYPAARRDKGVVDNLHGINVSDPYRWLENPDSSETKQFIEAQNKFSQSFLSDDVAWPKINKQLTSLWNYAKYDVPERHGNYYFSTMNTGLQDQDDLYKQSSLDEEPSLLLDVNLLSSDGSIALHSWEISPDGSLLAYSLSVSGSDWTEIRIREVETSKDFPDVLKRVKFSDITWTHDNKGFFYCRYDLHENPDGTNTDKNEYQKLYYHRIGDAQEMDVLVVEFPEHPLWRMYVWMSDDGKYLIVKVKEDSGHVIKFIDLEKHSDLTGEIQLTLIISDGYDYEYITNTGSKIVFLTNQNAPNHRLVSIDLYNISMEHWNTLVEEDPSDVFLWAHCVDNDKIVAGYLHDVKSEMRVYSLETGKLIRNLPLEIGSVEELSGRKTSSEVFFKLKSFLTPGTVYRYDFSTPDIEPTVYREKKLSLDGFDRDDFIVEQVFYPGRYKVMIPMFIVQKKTEQNSLKPALLYGYGGFASSQTPEFHEKFFYFVNYFNGILAIANIRGGGEYGAKWHNDGRLLKKRNGFSDFQAAAKYLVEKNYTEHKKIGIIGASNGGLLVGACINQRPDLFGAAVAQVGVLDMLRFHKFTTGHSWISDYGNPDTRNDFENLHRYSPLHNVRAPFGNGRLYPTTLILTGDHDDRVSPLHSLKFTAALQHTLRNNVFQTNPILLKVYKDVGHGIGKPIAKKIEETTDILTFLYRSLHIDDHVEL